MLQSTVKQFILLHPRHLTSNVFDNGILKLYGSCQNHGNSLVEKLYSDEIKKFHWDKHF